MIRVRKPRIFCKDKEKILKKYPKSSEEIKQELKKIAENPECGRSYPKLKGMRKIRIALKKYGISKRDGPVCYLFLQNIRKQEYRGNYISIHVSQK